jgi:DNA-binding IclR family transcriptional regulator
VTATAAPAAATAGPNGQGRGTPLNRSIERAARLLGLFSQEHPELSLAEITTGLEATKATTHRYTMALRRTGLLRYDAARQVYSLGPRIVELAASALVGLRIIKVAGPHMEQLVAAANETVVLSVWDGESPVVMRVEDNTNRIARILVRTGTRLPSDSAQGKVFAAFGGDGRPAGTSDGELAQIRAAGIAVNSRVQDGIRAIATPVFQETELVAALALVGTTASIPPEPRSTHAHALREAARALSAELGFVTVQPDHASPPNRRRS